MPIKQCLGQKMIIESVRLISHSKTCEGLKGNIRPYDGGQNLPDRMMLVGGDPRQPQPPFVPIGLKRGTLFCCYVTLGERVGVVVVRHLVLDGAGSQARILYVVVLLVSGKAAKAA